MAPWEPDHSGLTGKVMITERQLIIVFSTVKTQCDAPAVFHPLNLMALLMASTKLFSILLLNYIYLEL